MLAGGARYHAAEVPDDDTIARMYSHGIERLEASGLKQYEISNFARGGQESLHNLRYWRRQPYLGLGLDASSMLSATVADSAASLAEQMAEKYVLRSTTSDDLAAYLAGTEPAETAWLSPDRQHEEAWFLGLRLNAGVDLAAIEQEFGPQRVARALATVKRISGTGLILHDGATVRLTPQGRLLSNDVFQEFLEQDGQEEDR